MRLVLLTLLLLASPVTATSFGSRTGIHPAGENHEFLIVKFDPNDGERAQLPTVPRANLPADLRVYAYPYSGVYRNDGSLEPVWVDTAGILLGHYHRNVHISSDGRTALILGHLGEHACVFVYRDGFAVRRHMLDKLAFADSPTLGYAHRSFVWTSRASGGITYVRWIRSAECYQFSTQTGALLRAPVRAEAQGHALPERPDKDGDGIPQAIEQPPARTPGCAAARGVHFAPPLVCAALVALRRRRLTCNHGPLPY